MKKIVFIGILIMSVLFCQILNAQTRKERKQLKKQEKEQAESKREREREKEKENVVPVRKPVTPTAIQTESTGNTIETVKPSSERPTAATSQRKPAEVKPIDMDIILNNTTAVVSETANGTLNWTEQYIEAKGSTVIDLERFPNQAQARAMATRGAVVVAQRNLLEIINGVQVTSETTVKDMMTMGDFIYTRIDGVIKGAEMVGEPIEKDGMIEVRMRLPLYKRGGLAGALYDHIPQTKGLNISQETQNQLAKELQDQTLQALAFNLNGKQFDPALFPVIVDENNNIVLDLSKIYDPNTGNFPSIFNATQDLLKEIGYNKGVEFIDILKTEPGKLVIDDANLKKVNWKKIIDTAGSIGKLLMLLI